jgi:ribonuclease HII
MENLDKKYPQYGWAHNAGYLTKEHLTAIDNYGLTEYHRKSFLKKHFEKQLTLF